MKYNRLFVGIENKSGSIYQVALEEKDMDAVFDLISQLHGGSVKVISNKLPLGLSKTKKEAVK